MAMDKEICAECGKSVAPGSGRFVNRIFVSDNYEYRKEMGYPFPDGEHICEECEDEVCCESNEMEGNSVRDVMKDSIREVLAQNYNISTEEVDTDLVAHLADEAFRVCGIGDKEQDELWKKE
ncbi:MAG: hypothetical protein AB1401_00625 [Thermodesulfobacteriota bacterium]